MQRATSVSPNSSSKQQCIGPLKPNCPRTCQILPFTLARICVVRTCAFPILTRKDIAKNKPRIIPNSYQFAPPTYDMNPSLLLPRKCSPKSTSKHFHIPQNIRQNISTFHANIHQNHLKTCA
eukprot:39300_1